jgi:hypothetical protein
MKHNPAEKTVRDRLEPGALSIEGFLGHDDRPLADIIAADIGAVEAEGLTIEELGSFLEGLHTAADSGLESRVPMFGGRIYVRVEETMGQIPCPFPCGEHCHKAVIEVSNNKEEVIFRFTPLDAHLIRKHGFFEGKGSTYRITPAELIAFYRFCKA